MPLVKPVAIFCLQYKKFFPRVLHLNFKKDIDGAYFIRGLVANRQQQKKPYVKMIEHHDLPKIHSPKMTPTRHHHHKKKSKA